MNIFKASIAQRSQQALSSFTKVVDDLLSINKEAAETVTKNSEKINKLSEENTSLSQNITRNESLITKINQLLS